MTAQTEALVSVEVLPGVIWVLSDFAVPVLPVDSVEVISVAQVEWVLFQDSVVPVAALDYAVALRADLIYPVVWSVLVFVAKVETLADLVLLQASVALVEMLAGVVLVVALALVVLLLLSVKAG